MIIPARLGTVDLDGARLPALVFPGSGRFDWLAALLGFGLFSLIALAVLLDAPYILRWMMLAVFVSGPVMWMVRGYDPSRRRITWRAILGVLGLLIAVGFGVLIVQIDVDPGPIDPTIRFPALAAVALMVSFMALGVYSRRKGLSGLSLTSRGIHWGTRSELFVPWESARSVRVGGWPLLGRQVEITVSEGAEIRQPAVFRWLNPLRWGIRFTRAARR